MRFDPSVIDGFEWDESKSREIKVKRGKSLREIVECIRSGKIITVMRHHNQDLYPDQLLIVVEVDGYPWVVPCEIRGRKLRLITAYPSRKFKRLLGGGKDE